MFNTYAQRCLDGNVAQFRTKREEIKRLVSDQPLR